MSPRSLEAAVAVIEPARLPFNRYSRTIVGHGIAYPSGEPAFENVLYIREDGTLGKGQHGEVYKEEAQSECVRAPKVRAVKEIKKPFSAKYNIEWQREVEALVVLSQAKVSCIILSEHSMLKKPQQGKFVDFYGWFEDSETVFLAMEYFSLGDLSIYLNDIMEEGEVKIIANQLTCGLKVMHDYGIVHRDMKPQVYYQVSLLRIPRLTYLRYRISL